MKSLYAQQLEDTRERRLANDQYTAELDELAATTRQLEVFSKQVESEIAVTRRATYKAEEAITKLETSKQSQDVMIDSLNERIKTTQRELQLVESQLASQRNEAMSAQQTLADANKEMERIRFEKKQLISAWNSTLLGMQKRDQALELARSATLKITEETISLGSSEQKLRQAIKKEQEQNEKQTLASNKLEAELRTLSAAADIARTTRAKSEERFAMLNKAIEQTEAELAQLNVQKAHVVSEARAIETQVRKAHLEAKELRDAAFATVGDRLVLEKGASNAASAAEKLRMQVSELELGEAQLQNEQVRLHVETLNVAAHNGQLEGQLKSLNEELAEKDSLVAKYEMEARRRHTDIEKKQHDLDLLNRKFDKLMKQRAGVSDLDEAAGPLEAAIVGLKKEIAAKADESTDLQRLWIAKQAELVTLLQKNDQMSEEQQELRSRIAILSQKRSRIDSELEACRKEIVRHERQEGGHHLELGKMNRLIADYEGREKSLSDDTFMLESAFTDRLKENEADAVALESKIVSLQQEKESILLDVAAAEKAAQLITQKIALERETQAALDPEVGATESRTMQREIHRMKLRYSQLQRRQEMILSDMERAVYKRDNIEAKGRVTAGKRGAPPTQATFKKQISEMTKSVKKNKQETDNIKNEVSMLKRAQSEYRQLVESKESELEDSRHLLAEAKLQMEQNRLDAKLQKYSLNAAQATIRNVAGALEGSYKTNSSIQYLEDELGQTEAVRTKLFEVGNTLNNDFPLLSPAIQGILSELAA